jgi:hypothetical protein
MPVQLIDPRQRASKLLLEIDAVHFSDAEPLIFTSDE